MNNFNTKRILSAIAFLALTVFSCYWTAESLFIWQPSITRIGAWLIAVVFYVLASWCFGRFIKSFDRQATFGMGLFKSRAGHLVFGLLGLLVFWLMFSLPTNTHTLLYRSSIRNVITTDLERTDGYLKSLKDNNAAINAINDEYEGMRMAVEGLLNNMKDEVNDHFNPGIGEKFNAYLLDLQQALGGLPIQKAANIPPVKTAWQRAMSDYRQKAHDQLALHRVECDKKIDEIRHLMNSEKLNGLIERDSIAMTNIDNMSNVNNKIVNDAVEDLINDYAYIKTYSEYITFKNDEEENLYTRDGAMPEAKAMLSVPDVWRDFLTTDKYRGYGFIWWVLLALLVDLAAFIFFDIAARSDNDFAY